MKPLRPLWQSISGRFQANTERKKSAESRPTLAAQTPAFEPPDHPTQALPLHAQPTSATQLTMLRGLLQSPKTPDSQKAFIQKKIDTIALKHGSAGENPQALGQPASAPEKPKRSDATRLAELNQRLARLNSRDPTSRPPNEADLKQRFAVLDATVNKIGVESRKPDSVVLHQGAGNRDGNSSRTHPPPRETPRTDALPTPQSGLAKKPALPQSKHALYQQNIAARKKLQEQQKAQQQRNIDAMQKQIDLLKANSQSLKKLFEH